MSNERAPLIFLYRIFAITAIFGFSLMYACISLSYEQLMGLVPIFYVLLALLCAAFYIGVKYYGL